MLAIFHPFVNGSIKVEISQGNGNLLVYIWEGSIIEEEIGFEGGPKGISFHGRTIKWFRRVFHQIGGTLLCSHGRWRWWQG
jgi:hypothetical protein